jgi:hypothetical protein
MGLSRSDGLLDLEPKWEFKELRELFSELHLGQPLSPSSSVSCLGMTHLHWHTKLSLLSPVFLHHLIHKLPQVWSTVSTSSTSTLSSTIQPGSHPCCTTESPFSKPPTTSCNQSAGTALHINICMCDTIDPALPLLFFLTWSLGCPDFWSLSHLSGWSFLFLTSKW